MITAKTGTPTIMPTMPHMAEQMAMAMMTQRELTPVLSPRILGPMTLPSSCWMMRMRMNFHFFPDRLYPHHNL